MLPVDPIVSPALMLASAQLVLTPSPKLLTTNVYVPPKIISTLQVSVSPARLAVNSAPQRRTAAIALALFFSRALAARLTAIMGSQLWDLFVRDALRAAFNALKISSASTALTVFTCTMAPVTPCAQLAPSVITLNQTGIVYLATPPAGPA